MNDHKRREDDEGSEIGLQSRPKAQKQLLVDNFVDRFSSRRILLRCAPTMRLTNEDGSFARRRSERTMSNRNKNGTKINSDGVARGFELWRALSAWKYEDRRDKTSCVGKGT